jgi:hypothetical protein
MLFSIQFPFADSRAFVDGETGVLSRPTWPSPSVDREFVRSFGSVRSRYRGGIDGWIGENETCNASRALRFSYVPTFVDYQPSVKIPLNIAFRRLFFDGIAVGKFEVGISTPTDRSRNPKDIIYYFPRNIQTLKEFYYYLIGQPTIKGKQVEHFLDHLLNLPIQISDLSNGIINCGLGESGRYIAQLYLASSTATSWLPSINLQNHWIQAGSPIIFIQYEAKERIRFPFFGKTVPSIKLPGANKLSCYRITYKGTNIRVWALEISSSYDYVLSDARKLRLCLLRLHAEHECLRLILQNISSGRITASSRGQKSDLIQYYLNEATKRISRCENTSSQLSNSELLVDLARESEDVISPGQRDSLLKFLKDLDIRKNIFHKIDRYTDQWVFAREFIMGDKYEAGQVGAQGPNASAYGNTFNQIWNQASGSIDAAELARELSILRGKLKEEATEPEHDIAVGTVASAESAAKAGNGPEALKYLAKAGRWSLDIATKIGTTVAAKAIEIALGIST